MPPLRWRISSLHRLRILQTDNQGQACTLFPLLQQPGSAAVTLRYASASSLALLLGAQPRPEATWRRGTKLLVWAYMKGQPFLQRNTVRELPSYDSSSSFCCRLPLLCSSPSTISTCACSNKPMCTRYSRELPQMRETSAQNKCRQYLQAGGESRPAREARHASQSC